MFISRIQPACLCAMSTKRELQEGPAARFACRRCGEVLHVNPKHSVAAGETFSQAELQRIRSSAIKQLSRRGHRECASSIGALPADVMPCACPLPSSAGDRCGCGAITRVGEKVYLARPALQLASPVLLTAGAPFATPPTVAAPAPPAAAAALLEAECTCVDDEFCGLCFHPALAAAAFRAAHRKRKHIAA